MDQSKIGFTLGHGESIHVDVDKNFTKFLEMVKSTFDHAENLSENDNVNLSTYSLIIIGSPIKSFSSAFLDKIREYVLNGGKLFVLLKYFKAGEDNNVDKLFDEIKPNRDTLISNSEYNIYRHKPIVYVKDTKYQLDERILYDGGCTLNVTGDVELDCKIDNQNYTTFRNVRMNTLEYHNEVPITKTNNTIMAFKKIGKGAVIYFGSRWAFSDEWFDNSYILLGKLLKLLLDQSIYNFNVKQRMSRIQRHRLLHGFPMPEANYNIEHLDQVVKDIKNLKDDSKKIALGVVAHPMCNPQVKGCGYCPFPHEDYNIYRMKASIDCLINEVKQLNKENILSNRKISSLYFGGGTATLTEKNLFDNLCNNMKNDLEIDKDTEITLEGTPGNFVTNKELMEILKKYFSESSLRISLGVQTFDDEILRLAGRSLSNAKGSVEEAIKITKSLGIKVSADFLFNLPYRSSFDFIKKDLDKAVDLDIEHICWYSLVLNESIESPWAKDKEILASLPSKEQALDNWLKLYSCLKDYGYEAVTVTDFSKKNNTAGHYQYEEDLRMPDKVDWIGLGSYGISLLTSKGFKNGIKVINPNNLSNYLSNIRCNQIGWDTVYEMSNHDLKLYWITRKIKGTFIPAKEYHEIFGSNIEDDFGNELQALTHYELLECKDSFYRLTPKGFFYADTIAGHLAWQRVNELYGLKLSGNVIKISKYGNYVEYKSKNGRWVNDALHHYMG